MGDFLNADGLAAMGGAFSGKQFVNKSQIESIGLVVPGDYIATQFVPKDSLVVYHFNLDQGEYETVSEDAGTFVISVLSSYNEITSIENTPVGFTVIDHPFWVTSVSIAVSSYAPYIFNATASFTANTGDSRSGEILFKQDVSGLILIFTLEQEEATANYYQLKLKVDQSALLEGERSYMALLWSDYSSPQIYGQHYDALSLVADDLGVDYLYINIHEEKGIETNVETGMVYVGAGGLVTVWLYFGGWVQKGSFYLPNPLTDFTVSITVR